MTTTINYTATPIRVCGKEKYYSLVGNLNEVLSDFDLDVDIQEPTEHLALPCVFIFFGQNHATNTFAEGVEYFEIRKSGVYYCDADTTQSQLAPSEIALFHPAVGIAKAMFDMEMAIRKVQKCKNKTETHREQFIGDDISLPQKMEIGQGAYGFLSAMLTDCVIAATSKFLATDTAKIMCYDDIANVIAPNAAQNFLQQFYTP